MPPVLGPFSPSPTRLWSCAATSGSACVPSMRAKKLASSPTRHSSMTTSAPAAPNAPAKQCVNRGGSRLARFGDRDAFAGSQAVGLDDDRNRLPVEIGERGSLVLEAAVGGGRDAELGAEVLGEALGAFELGRGLGRAERLDAGSGQIVGEAGHQRRLRPDHDEVRCRARGRSRRLRHGRRHRARRTRPPRRCRRCPGAQ